jgi:hypothetical protein
LAALEPRLEVLAPARVGRLLVLLLVLLSPFPRLSPWLWLARRPLWLPASVLAGAALSQEQVRPRALPQG